MIVERPCPDCGVTVSVEQIVVGGVDWTPKTAFCPACWELERLRREAQAAAGAPVVYSQEEVLRRTLHAMGANVPLHGCYGLPHVLASIGDAEVGAAVGRFLGEVRAGDRWAPVRGLILEGPTGVGKSWLAVAIMRELIESRSLLASEVRYDRSRYVWGMIRSAYGDGTATRELEARMRARLWVLDDLGTEHPTDDAALNLTEILSARELRPTVITANVPREAQGQHYDAGVWARTKSRLGERNFQTVRIVGPDRRTTT